MKNPFTRTRCAGFSSGQPRAESVPIVNSSPGIQTMPGGQSTGDPERFTHCTIPNVMPNPAPQRSNSKSGRDHFRGAAGTVTEDGTGGRPRTLPVFFAGRVLLLRILVGSWSGWTGAAHHDSLTTAGRKSC